jgi:(E)-4-hydroxy-3-methyl-but-2-enyl pyrophosphate reductase
MTPTSTTTLPPATESPLAPKSQGRKTIVIAKHAGFCHGVKRAVDQAVEVNASADKPVYVLGELIHNPHEIERLASLGIQTVKSLNDVPQGSVCVIRTHGAPPETVEAAEQQGLDVSDATCPDVRLVQNKAMQLVEEGYTTVVVGKADHPEIIGILAHAERHALSHGAKSGSARIVAINKPADIAEKLQDLPKRKVGVVSQTTQMEENFFNMVKALSMVAKELKVFNTICPATYFRQNAALELASQVDFMVVIGGKNSSNTTHLAEICQAVGTPTVHVETHTELQNLLAQNQAPMPHLLAASKVGVTAGASTPDWIIQDVIGYLETL